MIYPVNRYLAVEMCEESPEPGPEILVPENIKINDSAFCVVRLIEAHSESNLSPGEYLLAHRHTVTEVSILGEQYYLVLENHIMGIVKNDGFK